jgi:hypothetical protein
VDGGFVTRLNVKLTTPGLKDPELNPPVTLKLVVEAKSQDIAFRKPETDVQTAAAVLEMLIPLGNSSSITPAAGIIFPVVIEKV